MGGEICAYAATVNPLSGNTRPSMLCGKSLSILIALVKSGTRRLSPFFGVGKKATLLLRSTLTHNRAIISPLRIADSNANSTNGFIHGLFLFAFVATNSDSNWIFSASFSVRLLPLGAAGFRTRATGLVKLIPHSRRA